MIVATAGHVDHGKTELVKALTGVDTDRLPEEKRRGLTIDLGFAYDHRDDGRVLGFVDVPGHEKFVRNMLAGVAAIDFALLVVAADDGPMPQTREHLDILDLLGVGDGAVAVTKIDLVGDERVQEVMARTTELLSDTALKDAPVFPVSAVTGQGLEALEAHLAGRLAAWRDREARGGFRFSVDRCFTLAGAGLVVTGAVVAGTARRDDRLVLSPGGLPLRVREIYAHDRKAAEARAGQRCALNIAGKGVEKETLGRGDWVVAPWLHAPVTRLDARIRLLAGEAKPLGSGTRVHVHLGAAETTGRVLVLGRRRVAPGEEAPAQLVLDGPIAALGRDRLVLRDRSARRTIAGGRVIDPFATARGRSRPDRLERLAALDKETPAEALAALLDLPGERLDLDRFAQTWNLASGELDALLADPSVAVYEARSRRFALRAHRWNAALEATKAALRQWHDARPAEPGPTDKDLRAALPEPLPADFFSAVVRELVEAGQVARGQGTLALSGHQPTVDPADLGFWHRVKPLLLGEGLRPPSVAELSSSLDMEVRDLRGRLLRLARLKLVVQVCDNRFFATEQVRRLAAHAEDASLAAADRRFTAGTFRDRTGIGRNLAIEVLEYFDRTGLTIRDAEGRRVAGRAIASER
jgi:selenocysteine-specific elongation factor